MTRLARFLLVVPLALAGCSASAPRRPAVPAEAEVRAQTAGLLAKYRLGVASFMVKDGHLGYYLKPTGEPRLDDYVAQLPESAEIARTLLARYPGLADVDVCIDGPWLPHKDKPFVPAARVLLKRADAGRWPDRFDDPTDVLVAGLDEKSLEYFLDVRVVGESPAYSAASRELSRRRKAS